MVRHIHELTAYCPKRIQTYSICSPQLQPQRCVEYYDINVFNCSDDVARYINSFISDCGFYRCDHLTPYHCKPTYINFALNHQSCIDFALSSNTEETSDFCNCRPWHELFRPPPYCRYNYVFYFLRKQKKCKYYTVVQKKRANFGGL